MPTEALLLALASAGIHALWNLLLAGAEDVRTAAAAQIIVSMVVWAPVALATWDVGGEALPYLLGASAFQLAYFALLVAAYEAGELSLVYPLARGGAPLIVALAAVVGVGGAFGLGQALGIVAIACGVIAVRGVRGPWNGRDTVLAGLTAAAIAGYTVLDRYGIRHASPLSYVWLELLPAGLLYLGFVVRTRGTTAIRAAIGRNSVIAGIGALGSSHSSSLRCSTARPPPWRRCARLAS